MSEFDLFLEDSQSSEDWDELDAIVDELEEAESEGNWARPNTDRVPPKYQEVTIPGLLEHHARVIIALLGIALGSMLRDWVKHLRNREMIRARELVQDVADVCTMAWSATRSEGSPDDDTVAVKWLSWAVDNGLVTTQQLADAYWLAAIHGAAGTNTPEDAMRLGMSRKLNAEHNRPAPISSDGVTYVAGAVIAKAWVGFNRTSTGIEDVWEVIRDIEVVDDTFEISSGDVRNPGRISSVRVSDRMPKGCALRSLFWLKFIEGKSRKFWVGEGNTERAMFKLVQDLDPKPTGKLTLKAGKVTIRVSPNPKAPALLTVPAAELLRVLCTLTDRWDNLRDENLATMYQLALRLHGAKEIPSWARSLNPVADELVGNMILCIRGHVEDLHLEVWGAVVDAWRELLGIQPPPAGVKSQLPGLTLTCLRCGKSAGSLYADGLCHACHRAENPI